MEVTAENVKYKITEFEPGDNQIVVEFENGPSYPIPLPVVNNRYPEGEELDKHIRSFFPAAFYEAVENSPVENVNYITSLMNDEANK